MPVEEINGRVTQKLFSLMSYALMTAVVVIIAGFSFMSPVSSRLMDAVSPSNIIILLSLLFGISILSILAKSIERDDKS